MKKWHYRLVELTKYYTNKLRYSIIPSAPTIPDILGDHVYHDASRVGKKEVLLVTFD